MSEKTDRTGKAFRKLLVWQRAHQLALLIYKNTEKFPKHEMFGLTSQVRRAAVSISAKIVEGYAAGSKNQFGRYLDIAQGSLAEVEYYLILALDLKYVAQAEYDKASPCVRKLDFYSIVSSNLSTEDKAFDPPVPMSLLEPL